MGRGPEPRAGARAVVVGERAVVPAGLLLGNDGELLTFFVCSSAHGYPRIFNTWMNEDAGN